MSVDHDVPERFRKEMDITMDSLAALCQRLMETIWPIWEELFKAIEKSRRLYLKDSLTALHIPPSAASWLSAHWPEWALPNVHKAFQFETDKWRRLWAGEGQDAEEGT